MRKAIAITENIYWVGAHDYNLRHFHGAMYPIEDGATYNAYLLIDEKITLIDTVEIEFFDEMYERICSVIGDRPIDNIIIQHAESDHSSGFLRLMEHYPQAVPYVSKMGEKIMLEQFFRQYPYRVVKSGETLKIGKNTLTFIEMAMIHWPDNMATYVSEAKVLFSNDAFGQHVVNFAKIDDSFDYEYLINKAKEYYANIVMPYGLNVQKKLSELHDLALPIDYIMPAHGVIWHRCITRMLDDYLKMAKGETKHKAIIVYESVWQHTRMIAETLAEGLGQNGIDVRVYKLSATSKALIMKELLDSRAILVGSGCYNNTIAEEVAGFMDKLTSLRLSDKYFGTFGSYGWNKMATCRMQERVSCLKLADSGINININYAPTEDDLNEIYHSAAELAKLIKDEDQTN